MSAAAPRRAVVPAVLLLMAAAALAAGCTGGARGRALRLNRDAAVAYDRRDVEGAWGLLEAAIREDPTLAEAWYNQAVIALEVASTDVAVDLFHEALEHAPGDARIRARLGMALLALGRDAEAREEFEATLRGDAAFAPAWFGLGLCLERAGEPAAAARCYRKGLALQPDASAFWARLLVLNPST